MKKRNRRFPLTLTPNEQLLGWLYLAVEFLVLPALLAALGAMLGITSDAVLNFLYYLLNFLVCARIFGNLLRKSLANAGQNVWKFLAAVCLGFGVYYACSWAMTVAFARLAPDFANVNDAAIAQMVAEHPILMTLSTVALVPLAEECLYRGLMFTPLRQKSRAAAYVMSTLAFCAIHVVGYLGMYPAGTLALCFVQYIPAGLCLAAAYDATGSIFAPILIHSAVNLTSLLCLSHPMF